MQITDNLACSLRSWRDRLDPAEVGLPAGRLRRAPGLRREELAGLAGLSVDYLARLEQGRASNPSPSVLAPLARALRLSADERDYLYRVAGHVPPAEGQINRHLTPGVQRVLAGLTDVPVLVVDPAVTVVARNALAEALFGDYPADTGPHPRNLPWATFTQEDCGYGVRTPEEAAAMEARTVADLHVALGRFPNDAALTGLVDDLRRVSPRFEELWCQRQVARRREDRKTYRHPEVGTVTFDCDVLNVESSDLSLIIYTAAPGSPDAAALALLGAIGSQRFAR